MTLHQKTLRLARKTKRSVHDICREADVKERWYYAFISGVYEDPGVNKTERVYNVLRRGP